MEQDILNDYSKRMAAANMEISNYKKLINTYSFMRLGIFALMIVAIIFGKYADSFTIIAIMFFVLLLCFTWLVSRQSVFEKQRKYFENLVKVNENEINSIIEHQTFIITAPDSATKNIFTVRIWTFLAILHYTS